MGICFKCGVGYVYKKTVAKLDTEYSDYLRLQEKFKDKK